MATPTTITEIEVRSWCGKLRTDTSEVGVRSRAETESCALFTTCILATGHTSRYSAYGRDVSTLYKPTGGPT